MTRIRLLLTILLSALVLYAGVVASSNALLPAEQAFKISAKWLTAERIQVRWDIADGYYMYRDKIGFAVTDQSDNQSGGNGTITSIVLPAGVTKQDALFGEVQVFTEYFTTDISVTANNTPFELIATGQGCNEPVGVCYPPMQRKIQFQDAGNAVWTSDSGQQSSSSSLLSSDSGKFDSVNELRSLLADGFQQPEFLDVDEAFKLYIQTVEKNKISAVFEIADGYYLYRDRIKFSNDGENRIQRVALPAGKVKKDPYFGEVAVFNSDFSFPVELSDNKKGTSINQDFFVSARKSRTENRNVYGIHEDLSTGLTPQSRKKTVNRGALDNLIIHASYQGCAEGGICYSPVSKSFDVSGLAVIAVALARPPTTSTFDTTVKEQTTPLETLFVLLAGAFFAGILLTFTPCVLPMIPILFSIIIGQSQNLTKIRGGMLAVAYVLGTVVTYAGMGALAGASGDQLQAYFQNVWAIGVLSALFFIMALSMFGLFEIRMPAFIQSSIQNRTSNLRSSIPLVFLLGLGSALIIGACVSPILISSLGIVMAQGDPLLGAQLMSVMAVGMGMPLIALGLGAGHVIPRVGGWMEQVNRGFGLMLIAVAIYLLGALPQVPILLLWGSFFIITGIFMDAIRRTPEHASNWLRLEKGIGVILLVWGILLIAGGYLGQRDIFRPLPLNVLYSILPISESGKVGDRFVQPDSTHQFVRVTNNDELEQQLSRARTQNKLLLIDYYADWCVDCIRMKKTTFADSRVKAILADKFITVQIDVTNPQDADSRVLKQRFGVFGPPAILFIERDGTLLKQSNFYGYMESDAFLSLITGL